MSSYCTSCGTPVGAVRFCGACGTPVAVGATTVAAPSTTSSAPPPSAPRPTPSAPRTGQPAAGQPVAAPTGNGILGPGKVDVPLMTLLSSITLGVMWLVWAYQEFRIYRRITGRTAPNLETYFWSYVGTLAATFFFALVLAPLALIPMIAGIVLGALFLDGWTRDRDEIAARYGATGTLTSRGGLLALWIGANVAGLTFIGIVVYIPLMIVLTVLIFQSHNRVVEAALEAGVDWR